MSEPLRARRDEEPHPDLARYEQVTGGGDRTGRPARIRAWFHRTTPRAVPRTDTRPAADPEKPAASQTPAKPVRHLTQDEISYFLARDPDRFFEEDFDRDLRFDRAIDREPELE